MVPYLSSPSNFFPVKLDVIGPPSTFTRSVNQCVCAIFSTTKTKSTPQQEINNTNTQCTHWKNARLKYSPSRTYRVRGRGVLYFDWGVGGAEGLQPSLGHTAAYTRAGKSFPREVRSTLVRGNVCRNPTDPPCCPNAMPCERKFRNVQSPTEFAFASIPKRPKIHHIHDRFTCPCT